MTFLVRILAVLLAISLIGLPGCAGKRFTLQKEIFILSELKGGKTLSIQLFKVTSIPKYDAEPIDNLRRYLAEKLASSLRGLNVFSNCVILGENEKAQTDLLLEGDITAVDEGEPAGIWQRSFGSIDPKNWALFAVQARIIKNQDSSIVYKPTEISAGRTDAEELIRAGSKNLAAGIAGFRAEHCLIGCGPVTEDMREVIDSVVWKITEDLKSELSKTVD